MDGLRRGLRCAAVALALSAPTAAWGCGTIGEAQQVIDRARLVNDLAARLDHASQLTYTAEYQLPGGASATIAQAQHPLRTAYTYPNGKLVVTPEATTDCRSEASATTCTLTPPESPSPDPAIALLDTVGSAGVVAPTLVVGLLTAAALDNNAVISQHDTTIAGEHATCVDVSGVDNAAASNFTACITAEGLLGSFKGTVQGVSVEISITRLSDIVGADAFDMPASAKTVDKRPAR
jgi:hypothetical protein